MLLTSRLELPVKVLRRLTIPSRLLGGLAGVLQVKGKVIESVSWPMYISKRYLKCYLISNNK